MAFEGICDSDMLTNGEFHLLRNTRRNWDKEGSVVIDCGAYIGAWTDEVLKLAQCKVEVHCFEPSPRNYAKLSKRAFPAHVVLNQCALGSSEGYMPLFLHASSDQDSLHQSENMVAADINVPVTTLDSYCAERGIERVSFVKIDAEGHDFEVLKGMQRLFQDGQVDIVQFEYSYKNINSRVFLKDIREYVNEFDYGLYKIKPWSLLQLGAYHPYFDDFRLSNYVLVRQGVDLSIRVDKNAHIGHHLAQL